MLFISIAGFFLFGGRMSKGLISWTLAFLILAIIAAIMGFTTVAGVAIDIAKILFIVFLILFVLSWALGKSMPA